MVSNASLGSGFRIEIGEKLFHELFNRRFLGGIDARVDFECAEILHRAVVGGDVGHPNFLLLQELRESEGGMVHELGQNLHGRRVRIGSSFGHESLENHGGSCFGKELDAPPRPALFRLHDSELERFRTFRGFPPRRFKLLQHRRLVEITGDRNDHVVRRESFAVVLLGGVHIEAQDRLFRSNHRTPVGVGIEGQRVPRLLDHVARLFQPLMHFLQHDALFVFEPLLLELEIVQCLVKNGQRLGEVLLGRFESEVDLIVPSPPARFAPERAELLAKLGGREVRRSPL